MKRFYLLAMGGALALATLVLLLGLMQTGQAGTLAEPADPAEPAQVPVKELVIGLMPDLHPAYPSATLSTYPYSPTLANALLDAAGWEVMTGGMRYKNGQPLAFTHRTSYHPIRQDVSAIFQENMADIGVSVTVEIWTFWDLFSDGPAGLSMAAGSTRSSTPGWRILRPNCPVLYICATRSRRRATAGREETFPAIAALPTIP